MGDFFLMESDVYHRGIVVAWELLAIGCAIPGTLTHCKVFGGREQF